MGSSIPTFGIGETAKKKVGITPEGAIGAFVGPLGFVAGQEVGKRRKERQQKKEQKLVQALTGEARATEQRAEAIKTAAEESVRAQQERARRRTVFAGEGVRESLFRRVLSGGPSRRALLGG